MNELGWKIRPDLQKKVDGWHADLRVVFAIPAPWFNAKGELVAIEPEKLGSILGSNAKDCESRLRLIYVYASDFMIKGFVSPDLAVEVMRGAHHLLWTHHHVDLLAQFTASRQALEPAWEWRAHGGSGAVDTAARALLGAHETLDEALAELGEMGTRRARLPTKNMLGFLLNALGLDREIALNSMQPVLEACKVGLWNGIVSTARFARVDPYEMARKSDEEAAAILGAFTFTDAVRDRMIQLRARGDVDETS